LQYVGQVGLGQRGPSLHIGWDRMGLGQWGLPADLSQSGTARP